MGRPKKPEPRDRQLNLSLTDAELALIERRAQLLGMRAVHFGRALLLDQRHQLPRQDAGAGNMNRLLHSQLSRLGNNLNQLVRYLHQTNDSPLPADLEPLLRDIRRLINRVPR